MGFQKPHGLGAQKQRGRQEIDEVVQRSNMQRARIEELCELQQSRDICLPELAAAFKNYGHLLVAIHKIKLDLAGDAATSEEGLVERASCSQNAIGAKGVSAPKPKLTSLARPGASKTIKKSNSTISTRARKLPNYALMANPARLVWILCKGDCTRCAWAEMDADYPGQEVLRRSQLRDFRAKCLRCGATALDCYNWLR